MLDVDASDYRRTWITLERRRAALLEELSQVERDMATLRQAAEVISRHVGVPAGPAPALDLLPTAANGPQEKPAARTLALPAPSSVNLPSRSARLPTRREPANQAIVAARVAMLGPPRDDARIPPKVDEKRRRLILADVPDGQAVREAYDRLAEISARAMPETEPGGRRRLSSRGLIAGEPLVPGLLAVLRAAGRPLSTSDCVMAALQQRGLRLDGAELCAVVSRASARLGDEARKKRVTRVREPHERSVLWMIARE